MIQQLEQRSAESPMAPAWLADADADERSDLAAVGLTLSPEGALALPDAQSAIDATASQLLRVIGGLDRDLKRYDDARAAEQALIQARHEVVTARLIDRKARLESYVRQLAAQSDFGSKRSRDVTYGSYGVRTVPDHLSIVDKKQALGWCRLSAPDLITIKQDETIAQKKIEAHFLKTGELPDGCEFVPAHDEPFLRVTEVA